LGDTTVRLLRATGERVEVHNYIDDTGVQVADVVVGFIHLEKRSLDQIKQLAGGPGRFDYYCWDLYSRVGAWYEEDKSRLAVRSQTLHEIEESSSATSEIAEFISSRIVDCHLNTMARLDISYDLLTREREIINLKFWARAFEKLKESGVIVFETRGRNEGCWVMKAEGENAETAKADSEHDPDKVIVRSNGLVNYTGKDIAYHLWKLGKLGLDFHYRPLRRDHRGDQVWTTTSNRQEAVSEHPEFGNGTAFLNVIDVGQSYPQENVNRGVMAIDHDERVARSAHLAYEKVTLTPAAAAELGVALSEADAQRQQIGMSGRKGLGVKADDLIDRLEQNALKEVQSRDRELSEAEQQRVARQIAVAALRYFLLKYTRTSIIAFDFQEALKFRGETGPYLHIRLAGPATSSPNSAAVPKRCGRISTGSQPRRSSPASRVRAEMRSGRSSTLLPGWMSWCSWRPPTLNRPSWRNTPFNWLINSIRSIRTSDFTCSRSLMPNGGPSS
jgi:arginyl-tRNA synthetase